ncbi:hypothetical protein [Streptomyces hydrogenans]
MLIEGYESAPLVAGDELTGLPGFWAAYLLWMCRTEENPPEPSWFGADEADTDAAYEALADETRWPVFRIPFSDGHSVLVVGRNVADEPGTEYVVAHPAWDRRGHLATIDGHHAGPGLSWRELTHIAGTPDPEAPGIQAPHVRLLLLLPVLGDSDLPGDAAAFLGDALVRAGGRPGGIGTSAGREPPPGPSAVGGGGVGRALPLPALRSRAAPPRNPALRPARQPALRKEPRPGDRPGTPRPSGPGARHPPRAPTDRSGRREQPR